MGPRAAAQPFDVASYRKNIRLHIHPYLGAQPVARLTGAAVDAWMRQLEASGRADGQGGQGAKQDTWRVLHQDAPSPLYWGWKNFYDEDQPMLTPEQTIAQVQPRPDMISYQ